MKVKLKEFSYEGDEKVIENVKNVKEIEKDGDTGVEVEYTNGEKQEMPQYGVYDAEGGMKLVEKTEKEHGTEKTVYKTVVGHWKKDGVRHVMFVDDSDVGLNSKMRIKEAWKSIGKKVTYELFDEDGTKIFEQTIDVDKNS